ncbi:MAG: hypothetical protein PHP23_03870 [Desulfobacterales bacterium]|nr:hypothetical protein [Desulfobacterales bacterium]MDD4071968.1 hypothetical protein [Desulfobacterales bacterium]MDD4391728.1 hypothetical protein [Desulfobacterales bacterium]
MYLSAFSHRDRLYHITNQWLSNQLEPAHPLIITRIISYDSFAAWQTLLRFIDALHRHITRDKLEKTVLHQKKDLKDYLCSSCVHPTKRIRSLISDYMNMPEFYYIGSPIMGYSYHDSHQRLISLCRFKRIKRIAEKVSRYAARYIFEKMLNSAGIAYQKPENDMAHYLFCENLIQSEQQIMLRIKEHGLQLPVEVTTIKDVLGMKLIDYGNGENLLESFFSRYSGAQLLEKEIHSGIYNAKHYLVDLKLDSDYLIKKFSHEADHVKFTQRGLPSKQQNEDFAVFMRDGSDTIQLDLILTSFEELIESEIGRSMHENRIFRQRRQQRLFGNIPVNIEYIVEYLLSVGLSATLHIDEIPIKLWGRYLEDTLNYNIQNLYNAPGYCLIEK